MTERPYDLVLRYDPNRDQLAGTATIRAQAETTSRPSTWTG